MMRGDFDFDAIKAANPIAAVIGRDLELKKSSRGEFIACCPFHDDRTPSFTVMPDRGRFHCFGCEADGDVIDYTRRKYSLGLPGACERLGGRLEASAGSAAPPTPRPAPAEKPYRPMQAVPDDVQAPPKGHPTLGRHDHEARVLNQAGELLYLVRRYEAKGEGGHKEIRPLCFDGQAWQWQAPPEPRPLYGLPLTPGLPVLVVEGEKKRDTAAEMLKGTYDVVSWPGGAKAVQKADWRLLEGLDVILWPDADEPGAKAAQDVRQALGGLAQSVHLVAPPPMAPAGWDIADAVAEGWSAKVLTDYVGTAEAVVEPRPAPQPEPPPRDPSDPGPQQDERAGSRRRERGASRETPKVFEWPEPIDFFADDSLGTPTLLPEHIPDALWPFVQDTAARMGVDPSMVALSALVAASSVISDTWRLQPKRHDYSWTEQPRLWGAIVGDPSIKKSPVISAATKPIDAMDVEARRRHGEAMRIYKRDLKAFKDAKGAKGGRGSGSTDEKPAEPLEPRHPLLDRYLVESTTVEALSEVLRTDDESVNKAVSGKVLIRQDEMSEFFANLDRYSKGGKGGGDRGTYLRLYNGGRFTVDRVMRGSFAVPNWSACFLGGIQPDPIRRIAQDTADDGLLQRFSFCVAEFDGIGVDRKPDHGAWLRYNGLFPALTSLCPPMQPGTQVPAIVALHDDAHQHREEIDSLVRAVTALPDTSKQMKAALGKWAGLFARLALTFHMIEAADANVSGRKAPYMLTVSEITARRVSSYMQDVLLPHLLRADALMFCTQQTGHAQAIAVLIMARKQDRIAMRDIQRDYFPFRKPEARAEAVSVMESLVTVGWLEPEVPDNPVKPVHSWRVNPKVHATFAERAARERAKREQSAEKVAEDIAQYHRKREAKRSKTHAA